MPGDRRGAAVCGTNRGHRAQSPSPAGLRPKSNWPSICLAASLRGRPRPNGRRISRAGVSTAIAMRPTAGSIGGARRPPSVDFLQAGNDPPAASLTYVVRFDPAAGKCVEVVAAAINGSASMRPWALVRFAADGPVIACGGRALPHHKGALRVERARCDRLALVFPHPCRPTPRGGAAPSHDRSPAARQQRSFERDTRALQVVRRVRYV
jgi:hypothetical protein